MPTIDVERDLLAVADRNGCFVHLNQRWEEVLGWSRDELMAKPFMEFVHPEDHGRTVAEVEHGSERDYEAISFENRYRTKAGEWRWLRWYAHSDGRSWLAVARDVTQLKKDEEILQLALDEKRLLAYSQPIFADGGQMVDEELLARVGLHNGDVAPPSAFVPVAEASGMIRRIDDWMLRQALDVASESRPMEVNVSARSITDAAFVDSVTETVAASPESAPWLTFEITESAAIEHLDEATRFAHRLTELGCRFALDDFGTGYGSLTYLRHLPVDTVKIDTSFVRGMAASTEDQKMVRSIGALARELGVKTIAEGVEDIETQRLLAAMGIDRFQGYFLGRPAPLV